MKEKKQISSSLKIPTICSGILLFFIGIYAQLPSSTTVLNATSLKGGLIVVIGSTDGVLETDLAKSGPFIVQGIATTVASRNTAITKVASSGLTGVVTIDYKSSLTKLPYADNLVSLVIADLDQLSGSGLTEPEIMRVLGFKCNAYLRKGGTWSVIKNPMPAAVAEWSHKFGGPEASHKINDYMVRPTTGMKWESGPHKPQGEGLVLGDGRHYSRREFKTATTSGLHLIARDAYNGTLLWKKPVGFIRTGRSGMEVLNDLVAANGNVYFYPGQASSSLVSCDGATGQLKVTYNKSWSFPRSDSFNVWWNANQVAVKASRVIVTGNKLIQTFKNKIWVLNESTGDIIWQKETGSDENHFYSPFVAENKVVVAISSKPIQIIGADQFMGCLEKEIVAYNLDNGAPQWTYHANIPNYDSTSPHLLIRLGGYGDGYVPVFYQGGRVEGQFNVTGAIRISDGKQMFLQNVKYNNTFWGRWINFISDGKMYCTWHWGSRVLDITTGVEKGNFTYPVRGCNLYMMTPNYLIVGGMYMDLKTQGTTHADNRKIAYYSCPVFRGFCGENTIPSYGQTYAPPVSCKCESYLPGYTCGYHAEKVVPLSNTDRVYNTSLSSTPTLNAAPSGLLINEDMELANFEGMIGSFGSYPQYKTTVSHSVTVGSLTITANSRLNVVTGKNGSTPVWNFVVNGRISQNMIVSNDNVLVASHDGYVYCLRASDGLCQWRTLVAPMERRVVAFSQLESAWPILGFSKYNDLVITAAGRHVAIDDGVWVYAIRPQNGSIAWSVNVRRPLGTNSIATSCPTMTNTGNLGCHYFTGNLNGISISGTNLTVAGVNVDINNPKDIVMLPEVGGIAVKAKQQPPKILIEGNNVSQALVQARIIGGALDIDAPSGLDYNIKIIDAKGKLILTQDGRGSAQFLLSCQKASGFKIVLINTKDGQSVIPLNSLK